MVPAPDRPQRPRRGSYPMETTGPRNKTAYARRTIESQCNRAASMAVRTWLPPPPPPCSFLPQEAIRLRQTARSNKELSLQRANARATRVNWQCAQHVLRETSVTWKCLARLFSTGDLMGWRSLTLPFWMRPLTRSGTFQPVWIGHETNDRRGIGRPRCQAPNSNKISPQTPQWSRLRPIMIEASSLVMVLFFFFFLSFGAPTSKTPASEYHTELLFLHRVE